MGNIIKKDRLSNQACRYIQEKIISGELGSGERLVETSLAKELGISQSPVRDALRELEVMGLVVIKPYTGCFVLPVDEKRVQQIYSLRALLECYAVREGLEQITGEAIAVMEETLGQMVLAAEAGDTVELSKNDVIFHRTMVEAAKIPTLDRMWSLVGAAQWTNLTISLDEDIHYFPESHRKLLAYAKERDAEKAAKELELHFLTAKDSVVRRLKKKQSKQNAE